MFMVMGKASKWFRGLLGLKRPESPPPPSSATAPKPPKEKRRWSFVKSYREKDHTAAAVARLTSTAGGIVREEWAAIKIQAAFRGSLARKALRALKGLVKLQALVRGHIERKRTAEWLQRVQAVLRVQAQILHSPYWNAKSSTSHLHGPATPDKFESPIRSESIKYDQTSSVLKRNGSKSRRIQMNGNQEKCRINDEQQPWNQRRSWTSTSSSLRILESDSVKPHTTSKRRNLSPCQALDPDHYGQSLTTTLMEVHSYGPLKINEIEGNSFCAADNSPQTLSASSKDGGSKKSPFTPTKSDGSRSYLSGYSESEIPSYMAYTESSMAKVRSLSAPKQRPQFERSSSSSNRASALHANFTSKVYPGSGRLDKLGFPVGYRY